MNTDEWNPVNKTEVKENPVEAGGGKGSRATAPAMVRVPLVLAALLLLPTAGLAAQGTTGLPAEATETRSAATRSNSLATEDEQPVADELMRRLWRNRLAAPKSDEDLRDHATLTELVQKVRSVTFELKKTASAAVVIPESPSTGAPVEVPAAPQPTTGPTTATTPMIPASAAPEGTMPSEVMEALRQLLADPNQASDPTEMAELLFLSGRLPEAAVFYRKALEVATRSAPAAKEDRAWVLLQLGNCLRETQAAQARAMYSALATEYPDSPWAEFAKAQSQFLTWSETARPRQWVSPSKGQEVRGEAPKQASQP